MPVNKNALIRYQAIDECLRNTNKKWTLEMIKKKVEEKLFEKEKISSISIRTLQNDIFNLKSNKLGYEAPIKVYEKKYYKYTDPTFRLHDAKLNEEQVKNLTEALDVITQFVPFKQFANLNEEFTKLEQTLKKGLKDNEKYRRYIQLDETEKSIGTHWIPILKTALKHKITLRIKYKPFDQKPYTLELYPHILKEYNNRWYILGVDAHTNQIQTKSLDRMEDVELWESKPFQEYRLNLDNYFDNCIGVTKTIDKKPIKVIFNISKKQFNYLNTKPLHPSQKKISSNGDWVKVSLEVIENKELQQKLLTFCPEIEVLEPEYFRETFKETLKEALKLY
jgi:predicted DNA-binding transcriptional regulator YafY